MIRVEVTSEYEDWWKTLDESFQDDVIAIVELLEERGVRLPFPYSSGIVTSKYSQMRELRIQSHGQPLRIFYAFDPRRIAILLIGALKKGNDKLFYKKYVSIADKLYKAHLDELEERQ